MAVDALEYDESAEDANPAGALEEILENPERLKDLDLDAFAEELERQVRVCARVGMDTDCACSCQSNISEQPEKISREQLSSRRVKNKIMCFFRRVTATKESRCTTSALN